MSSALTPAARFAHDCEDCSFLGSTDAGDWWACGDPMAGGELIRRWGSEGPQYSAAAGPMTTLPMWTDGIRLWNERNKPVAPWAPEPLPVMPPAIPEAWDRPVRGRAKKADPVRGETGFVAPEWEADIASFGFNERAARALLQTRSFRNEFRKNMRDQIVAWLETPASERKYKSPLSYRQWECVQPFDPRRRW